ncbi:MAG: hypothetical protein GMKNLPBB_00702 [Myxococcota bacterium]|nr:hypothetical protein [Myxococcota bacterium]
MKPLISEPLRRTPVPLLLLAVLGTAACTITNPIVPDGAAVSPDSAIQDGGPASAAGISGPPPRQELVFANGVDKNDPRYAGQLMFLHETWDTEGLAGWPPADWMVRLQEREPEVFGDQFSRFGFIPDPADDLPVGFKRGKKDPARARETCAICHVAELPDGRLWLGAPNRNLDLSRFNFEVDKRWVSDGNPTLFDSKYGKDKALEFGPGRTDASTGAYKYPVAADFPPYFTLGERTALNYMGTGQEIRSEAYLSIFAFGAGDPSKSKPAIPFPPGEKTSLFLTFFASMDAPKGPPGDGALIARGETVFKEAKCIACHNMKTGPDGRLTPDVNKDGVTALDDKPDGKERLPGEDPAFPRGSIRTSFIHYQMLQGGGDPEAPPDGSGNTDAGRGNLLKFIVEKKLKVRPTDGYRVNDLRGLWATAPYLHNGSVPTLEDLLKPAADRPKKFRIGPAPGFEVDTTRKGNSNQGHEWGVALPAEDKRALVEFLKSL